MSQIGTKDSIAGFNYFSLILIFVFSGRYIRASLSQLSSSPHRSSSSSNSSTYMNTSSIPDFKRPLCKYSTLIIFIMHIIVCRRLSTILVSQKEYFYKFNYNLRKKYNVRNYIDYQEKKHSTFATDVLLS